MQSEDAPSALHRNEEISQLLRLWMWCSRSLHVKWEREDKHRNTCLMGIAWAINEGRLGKKVEFSKLLRTYRSLPFPLFTKADLLSFWRVCPSAVLEMALGCYTQGSPLLERLDLVRLSHQTNPRLDRLHKIMASREERYGSGWPEEGHHPESEFRQLEREIAPLFENVERLVLEGHAAMEALAREVLAQAWERRPLPASWFVRRTPESLLNRSVRLKLWLVAQEISFRNLDEKDEIEALCDGFYRAITPAVKAAIKAQGYTVDNVVDDFLNFDRHKSREEITQAVKD
jgi:hypothetical protein